MSDWRIKLEAKAKNHPAGVDSGATLEVLEGTRADAIEALEGWAAAINDVGYVPDSLEFRNRSGAHVGSRASALRFHARVDCFEYETDAGGSTGAAWLYAEEVF